MKTPKGSRPTDVSDELRKAKRLEPNRKSGKERHELYGSLPDDEEDEADAYLRSRNRSASALDYLDDGEEADETEEYDDSDEEGDEEDEEGDEEPGGFDEEAGEDPDEE